LLVKKVAQFPHQAELRNIEYLCTRPAALHQPGLTHAVKMKGRGGRAEPKAPGQLARTKTVRTSADQQAECL